MSLSWERMATAGLWLHVMLCDWHVVSVMCRRSIDTWAWAAFSVLVYCWVFTWISFPLILHLRPLVAHLSIYCFVWLLVLSLFRSMSQISAFIQLLSFYSLCVPVSLWTNLICLFSLFILLTVFSKSEGWQTFTNDSTLFNTDSAYSDCSKSKVMSSLFPYVSHKSFIPLSLLFVYS